MKRRGRGRGSSGGAPADLLVCFPSRAHLALMPKPICSPSRATDAVGKRHAVRPGTRAQASPLFKTVKSAKTAAAAATTMNSDDMADEPTSPKITCAGQIKVRTKSRPTPAGGSGGDKNWIDTLSLKKDVMHFIGALRGLRFNMHCFGAFPGAVDCTSDEDEDEEDEEEEDKELEPESSASRPVFSKWLMLLEEETQSRACKRAEEEEDEADEEEEEEKNNDDCSGEAEPVTSGPPANALLLMRCRSAPAKGWLKRDGGGGGDDHGQEAAAAAAAAAAKVMIKEKEEEEERLVLMSYAPDFFKISTDVAKETWVVGSVDPLARSRSWRR